MKKTLLLLSFAIPALHAAADVIVAESFPYAEGNITSQGMWVTNGVAGSNPINIVADNLTRAGYQDEASGNAARLDMSMGKNATQRIFATKDEAALEGPVYYSALVRVDEFPSSMGKPGAIMSLTGVNAVTGEFGDALTGSEGAGLFVRKGSDSDHAVFGISRRSSPNGIAEGDVAWSDVQVEVGATTLIVVNYSGAADSAEMQLWVNPLPSSAETPDAIQGAACGVEPSLADIRGIQIAQRSALVSKIPAVTIDEVRVATSFAEIFTGQMPPVTVANITLSQNPIDFGQVFCGIEVERTLTVSASDLTADITLIPGESGLITPSTLLIPAAEAMADGGYQLTITLNPQEGRYYSDRITFSSPGAQDKVLILDWHPVPSLVANTLRELCDEDSHDMTSVYVYTGEATVTFVESYYDLSYDRVVNSIFAQDGTGGVELRSASGCGYQEVDISNVKVGDNITNIVGYLIFGDSGLTMIPREADSFEVVSHGNSVEPMEVTLLQIAQAADGYFYGNQLVKVRNVYFPDEYYNAGDYYGIWNSAKYEIYDGTLDDYEGLAWMWCNKGADYFKTSTEGYFNSVWTMTGYVNNYYPIHISPRGIADFEYQGPKPTQGIAEIAGDAEISDIYDLQGRRVDGNPAPGIYIVRFADGKVSKINL